jgi:hypothetical protein
MLKHKINVYKDNFLHFQCIECTNFKTIFYLFMYLTNTPNAIFNIFLNLILSLILNTKGTSLFRFIENLMYLTYIIK